MLSISIFLKKNGIVKDNLNINNLKIKQKIPNSVEFGIFDIIIYQLHV